MWYKDDWLNINAELDNNVRLVNDVTGVRHNPLATSASSNKPVSDFYLFGALYA